MKRDTCTLSMSSQHYSFWIRGSRHVLCGHPRYNLWCLFNEDTQHPATHDFQVIEMSEKPGIGYHEVLNFSILLITQVANVPTGSKCTVHYGPEYVGRDYGVALRPRVGSRIVAGQVWEMLARQGLSGNAALQELLARAAPLDDHTALAVTAARRHLGIRGPVPALDTVMFPSML